MRATSILLASALLTCLGMSTARADISDNSWVSPSLKAASAYNMANLFTSCISNPVIGQIGDLATTKAMGANPDGTCPGSGVLPDAGSLECSQFLDKSEEWDPAKFRKAKESIEAVFKNLQCQQNQVTKVKAELNCLSQQANSLSYQIAAMQGDLQQYLQKQQTRAASLNAAIADRSQQIQDVEGILVGRAGSKGLLKIKEDVLGIVGRMPNDVATIQEAQKLAVAQRKALEEDIGSRKMALANECFSGKKRANFHCVPNGPAVTAREFVLCRFEQNQHLGANGQIERSELRATQAAARRAELETLLDSVLGDSPTQKALSTTEGEAQARGDQPNRIMSAEDVMKLYGDQLAAFNGNGLDIRQFIEKEYKNCYKNANANVERERKRANSSIGVAQFKLLREERAVSTQVNRFLNEYAEAYSQAISGLSGQHAPINLAGCQNAKPEIQLGCMADFRKNMEGMLAGTSANSTMQMTIRGTNPANNVAFKCQGLNGCINSLQNLHTNLGKEVQKVKQLKEDEVLKANQQVDNFVKNMAARMSAQSQALDTRLKALNTTLAMLGVRGGVDIRAMRGENLGKDKDGLYEMPKNILGVIGSQTNPPLLDVQGDNFSGALEGLSDKVSEISEKQSEAARLRDGMTSLQKECQKKVMDELKKELAGNVTQLTQCASADVCQQISEMDSLDSLIGQVRQIYPTISANSPTAALFSFQKSCNRKIDQANPKQDGKPDGAAKDAAKQEKYVIYTGEQKEPESCLLVYNGFKEGLEKAAAQKAAFGKDAGAAK